MPPVTAGGELACASPVLPRVQASIVEGPTPLLSIGAWRHDQPRLGRLARAGQTQPSCDQTSQTTTTVLDAQAAASVNRRLCCVGEADRFRELQPGRAQQSRVERHSVVTRPASSSP